MDKYEYKLRLEEIKTLNRKGRFQEAAQVADTVDWKKVRNVSTLGIISDVYKVNRRFEDAKEILLLAKEQSPQNRRILYSLCDLTIKMGQVVEAVEYYKEYVQMAPNDSSKYILLYKIYEAQDISLDERIAVLKEYKKREYNEKWAYELASLYHRCGYATECVEECDQLILWFGEGKYVAKAMELKMRYVPLSPAQKQAYDRMFGRRPEQEEEQAVVKAERQTAPEPVQEAPAAEAEMDIQVKTMDMSKYNTMNLQAALAESMREVMEPEQEDYAGGESDAGQSDARAAEPEEEIRQAKAPRGKPAEEPYAYGGDNAEYQEDVDKVMRDSAGWDVQATGQLETDEVPEPVKEPTVEKTAVKAPGTKAIHGMDENDQMNTLLQQEYDGQISMAISEERPVEKQITGQMNIQDVLAEWEKLKKKNEEKRRQETRQWMLQQTGSLFEDFDQLSRDGVLEKLQREEALPPEDVQKGYRKDADSLPEVEELEEIEDADALPEENTAPAQQAVRPAPANAAARAVMAAQGIMEETPIARTQATVSGEQQNVPEQLSEADQKRIAIEALIREAEAKQREAQALLMELERERLGLAGQQAQGTGVQAARQPEASAAEQPMAQAGQSVAQTLQQSGTQATQQFGVQAGQQSVAQAGQQFGTQTLQQPGTQAGQQSVAQAGQQFVAQTLQQPGTQAGQQSVAQVAQQSGAQALQQFVAQTLQQPGAQALQQSGVQAEQQSGTQAGQQSVAQASQQSGMQAAQQFGAQALQQPGTQVAQQSGAQAGQQSVAQVAQQPGTQAVQQSGAQAGQQPGTQPAQQSVAQPAQEQKNAAEAASGDKGGAPAAENTQAFSERIREQQLEEHERNMTRDEKELFAPYVPTKGAMRQLVKALDALSLSAFTGNMIITGAPGSDMMKMAKSVVKKMRASDRNFSGKLARISGDVLNTRNAGEIVSKLPNGALIIEKGGRLSDQGAENLMKALNQEQTGIIVFLLDSKKAVAGLLERCPQLAEAFTARFDIAALDTGTLVKYGCQYAYNMEYSIDELGRLALHTRIEDMQTRDHAVTVEEVREIIEEAIDHAERFSIRHFLDILFRRRYDDDDMIILRERDFI